MSGANVTNLVIGIGNVGDATILLYLVVTLTLQRYALLARVRRQEAAGQVPVAPGA